MVQELLDSGAKSDARTSDSRSTPLHLARSAGVAGLLLKAGAAIDACDAVSDEGLPGPW